MFLNHITIQWILMGQIFLIYNKDQINQKRNILTRIDYIGIDWHQFGIVA